MQFCLSFSPGNSSTHTMWGYRDLAKSYFVLLPGYSTPGQLCEMKGGFINPDTSVMNQNEIKRRQRGDEKGGVKPVPQGILKMAWRVFSQNKQEKKKTIISICTLLPRMCIYENWNSTSDDSISLMSYFSVTQNMQDVHCFFQSLICRLSAYAILSVTISLYGNKDASFGCKRKILCSGRVERAEVQSWSAAFDSG